MADGRPSLDILVDPPPAPSEPPRAAPPRGSDDRRDPRAEAGDPVAPRAAPRWRSPRVVAAVVVVALVVAAVARLRADDGDASDALDRQAVDALVEQRVTKALEQERAQPATSAAVYRTILPSLVVIRAEGTDGRAGEDGSLGAGVIVNADGSIMTAQHVIDGAGAITVRFSDGTESTATVRSEDRDTDIAVLAPATLPEVVVPATLGGGVRVGDETFAIGHPLGLVASLSAGVISGLDRAIPREDGGRLSGLIQFDAAVNPGNSGGPLLDRAGRVVGIVTAIADPSQDGSFIGIGFAVPIATAGGAAGAPPR